MIDDSYESLVRFYQSRNCGTGPGGFQTGNTCASAKAADAAAGAAKGAVKGAAIGAGLTWTPAGAAKGAAVGAAAGAIGGLVKNSTRPRRVMKTIEKIGSSEEKVASLVKKLGGSPKSSADVEKGHLTLNVVNREGRKVFSVKMNDRKVVIAPSRKSGRLSDGEVSRIKKMAEDHFPKSMDIVIKSKSPSYMAKLVKSGFKITADAAGTLVASFVAPFAPGLSTTAAGAAVAVAKRKPYDF